MLHFLREIFDGATQLVNFGRREGHIRNWKGRGRLEDEGHEAGEGAHAGDAHLHGRVGALLSWGSRLGGSRRVDRRRGGAGLGAGVTGA